MSVTRKNRTITVTTWHKCSVFSVSLASTKNNLILKKFTEMFLLSYQSWICSIFFKISNLQPATHKMLLLLGRRSIHDTRGQYCPRIFLPNCHLFSGNRVGKMVTFSLSSFSEAAQTHTETKDIHKLLGRNNLLYLIVKTNDICA